MKRWLPYLGLVVGISIIAYALLFGSSDEDQIRGQLDRLQQVVAVPEQQTNLVVRAARINEAFNEIFVKDVGIDVPELTSVSSGRRELVGVATRAPTLYRTASVDLGGLSIAVDQAAISAHVTGQVVLTATRHAGDFDRDTRTVSIRFDKIDDQWLIVSVTVSAKQQDE